MINFRAGRILDPSSKTAIAMHVCKIAKSHQTFLYTPTFPFPPFLFPFFSFHQHGNGPPSLGRQARNTPGGFVTGGWARFCGLAEPALTFYGHVTTPPPRGQNRNPIPVNSPWNRTLRWRHRPRNGISL